MRDGEKPSWNPGTPVLADLSEPAARAVAKWWADHARKKTPKNNGEPMHGMLADMITKDVNIDEALIQRFEDALVAEIFSDKMPYPKQDAARKDTDEYEVDRHKTERIGYHRARFSVDYGPDCCLARACEAADITDPEKVHGCAFNRNKLAALMPWKSGSRISMVTARAGAGYGEQELPIYSTLDERMLAAPTYLNRPPGAFQVVDRWRPGRRYEPGMWERGGDPTAKLALVTLSDNVVPTPIALVMRGVILVDSHSQCLEDGVRDAFRDEVGGYLALVKEIS